MKKLMIFCLGMVSLLSFSACETTNVYPNTSKSFVYSIAPNQWNDSEFRISHTLNLPELTDYYIRQGNVSVAISFDNEESYDILPATFDGVAYSVRYSRGRVTIFAEDPLLDETILVPIPESTVKIKVVLTEADYIE